MPGEGSLYKVEIAGSAIGYFSPTQDALVVEAPDGTRTTVVAADGTIAQELVTSRPSKFGLGAPEVVTIASGVATVTQSFVALAAESSTTDQVDSIVAAWAEEGDLLYLIADTGDTITVDDANIDLGAATRAIAPGGTLVLRFDGTSWVEVSFLAAADNS